MKRERLCRKASRSPNLSFVMKTTFAESAVVLRAWGVLALAVTAVYLLFYLAATWLYHSSRWQPLPAPNEQVVAYDALAARFTGDGYFHGSDANADSANSEERYWVPVSQIRDQVARVARARQLDDLGVRHVNELIERMTTSSGSRTIRSQRVNVLQLNLALDQNFKS